MSRTPPRGALSTVTAMRPSPTRFRCGCEAAEGRPFAVRSPFWDLLRRPSRRGGCLCHEPGENLGVWDRYGFSGKIITLARGACLPWAPPHAGSKLIRASMRLLPARYTVVTASVDATAGEVGTLYQACNFAFRRGARERRAHSRPQA